jgi:hypothetical protein
MAHSIVGSEIQLGILTSLVTCHGNSDSSHQIELELPMFHQHSEGLPFRSNNSGLRQKVDEIPDILRLRHTGSHDHKGIITLVEDILLKILCFCDIPSVLSMSQVSGSIE